ncbi:MAG: nuclear transport factor 2 family protein [Dehalococcoidia bacterium]
MASVPETVAAYIAAWSETDDAKRRALIEQAWAEDGLYVDPAAEGRGRDALAQIIAGFHAQAPGGRIDVASGIDQHHNQVRFAWNFVQADGKTAIEGIDVGELAEDGRLARIVGFWGAPPAKA